MENKIITRQDLKNKLKEYVTEIISLENLQNWELEMNQKDFEPNDWDEDDSLINEILHKIDMSDIDGLSKNKAKEMIQLFGSKEKSKMLIERLHKLE